ncbi:GAF domain-containing protein [Phenylobacterium sp.]|uniref:GAF domain-containing protein n=1 Tax=Phenylobacterium sp. TaxID=1871053 RepID=UPI002B933876|nr:GAF domain-containing protein [Phenylobacterium sp.]HVI31011.1 GAF domain-containing protein [Phenylobacterium sp.]
MDQRLAERLAARLSESPALTAELRCADDLEALLDGLLRIVEHELGGDMLTSILLLDETGTRLLHGAAPRLPDSYSREIHGVEIGPSVGSCGTAAYLGHPVYVVDIARDPLWTDYRDLAAAHGLAACWSTPIERPGGDILGAFAVYHRQSRGPSMDEVDAIGLVSRMASLAIERFRAGGALVRDTATAR